MWAYFTRRFLLAVPTLLLSTIIVFYIVQKAPGGPVERAELQLKMGAAMSGETGSGSSSVVQGGQISDAALEEIKRYYNLDKPAIYNSSPATRSKISTRAVDKLLSLDGFESSRARGSELPKLGVAALPALLDGFGRLADYRSKDPQSRESRGLSVTEQDARRALLFEQLTVCSAVWEFVPAQERDEGPVAERLAAWRAAIDAELGRRTEGAREAAIGAYFEASEAELEACLAALAGFGAEVLPELMDRYFGWFVGEAGERRAARALCLVASQATWNHELSADDRGRFDRQLREQGLDGEALAAGLEVQRQRVSARHRVEWRRWWDRHEEYFVEFGGLGMLRRRVSDTQYARWLWSIAHRDFGDSAKYERPVWDLLLERFPISISIGLIGFLLGYMVCIPLGIAKAIKHNSHFDFASSVAVFIGYSIPGWAFGMVLLVVLAGKDYGFGWFPLSGFRPPNWDELDTWGKVKGQVMHAVLPVTAYMIGSFATLTILTKNSLMENLGQDYVRTAFAKGLDERRVIVVHAMRNSLIPLATGLGHLFSLVLAGSFLIEKVFEIHGMGMLGFTAVLNKDQNIVMGILLMSTGLNLFGNIMQDFLYCIFDPRIRFR